MDYRTVGLKVGLEIHQQLATHKLFCEDASVLVDAPGGQRFRRRLRPTQSELGEVDAAAIEEAKRRLTFVYETTVNSCLVEADAARKLGEAEGEVAYRLDRLGIPLVEIATSPDIETPEEAREVALAIGSLLRATRKVLRGIGTIREDLNVSIRGGSRVEIKGVQDLRLIATFVEREVERQRMLLEVAGELKKRGVHGVTADPKDVTAAFRETQSKVVATAITKGGVVMGWVLPGFEGLLKGKLGPELAAHARIAGFAGVF